MAEGFTVESRDLTVAAGRVEPIAGQVSSGCAPATTAAGSAAPANPGFLTSSALTEVCARFAETAGELAGQVEAHAAKLRTSARAYQDVEERNAGLFRPGG